MEVFTGYPNHSNDPVVQKDRKMGAVRGKSERNAIRVCGDWSEQLSSKGKIYFYNCITEVSQWQKPAEWKLPDMNHDEIVKILKSREHYHEQKKRARISTASVQDITYADHYGSPKRIRYSTEIQNRLNVQHTRSRESQNSTTDSKYVSQDMRLSSQSSPSNTHLLKLPPRRLMQTGPRQHPADDMEISPNSSPLSDGSSPVCVQNNLSPRHPKYARPTAPLSTLQRTLIDMPRSQRPDHKGNCSKSSAPDSTLQQLVDVIRSSLGGLIDSNDTSNRVSPPLSPNERKHDSLKLSADMPDRLHSPTFPHDRPDQSSRVSSSVLSRDYPSGNFVSITDPCAHPSGERQFTHRDRDGYVAITTAVTLIGNAKHSNAAPVSIMSGPASYSSFRRSSAPYLLPTPHSNASPTVPSPSTAHLNANCIGRSATSQSSLLNHDRASGSSNQMDEIPFHANNSAQSTRSHFPRSTIEYYHTHNPQVCDTNNPLHAHASDHSTNSPGGCLPRIPSHALRSSLDVNRLDRESVSRSVPMNFTQDSPHDNRYRLLPETSNAKDPSSPITSACYRSPHPHRSPRDKFLRPQSEVPLSNAASLHLHSSALPTAVSSENQLTSYSRPADVPSSSELQLPEDEIISRIDRFLNSSTTQSFVDPVLSSKYVVDKSVERLEQEATAEARRFERYQGVFYGELSVESKKLRSLVRMSEAKLAIHREKQTALQELMDTIENRRHLPHSSFSDDV